MLVCFTMRAATTYRHPCSLLFLINWHTPPTLFRRALSPLTRPALRLGNLF